MRVSVTPGDPGFDQRAFGAGIRVFLDGHQRKEVFTADEQQRLVIILKRDEQGRIVLNEARDEALTESLYGDVRIELPEWWHG
jgi:hypothetical protein